MKTAREACLLSLSLLAACPAGKPANGPECNDADDIKCPQGEVCVDFKCYLVCLDSWDCEAAEACIDDACQPYAQSCANHGECVNNWFCNVGACQKKLPLGSLCPGTGLACRSGFCSPDNRCCDESCDGECEECSTGNCRPVPDGGDPDHECDATCDGAGGCWPGEDGNVCTADHQCNSGFCADMYPAAGDLTGVCCMDECAGVCRRCDATGNEGTCVDVVDATDVGTCDGTQGCGTPPCWCDAVPACDASPAQPCSENGECTLGPCLGGFCCFAGCPGTCMSCNSDETGARPGECTPILAGQDPRDECNGTAATSCNGVGGCFDVQNAESCTYDYECASGFCVDYVCCATECLGECRSCDGVDTNPPDNVGVCTYVANWSDPWNECDDGAAGCNGSGACWSKEPGTGCNDDAECSSGLCCGGACLGEWEPMANPATALYGIWGLSDTDVFAVGWAGAIFRYYGDTWVLDHIASHTLHAVSGSGSDFVIAVGDGGTIVRYEGFSATETTTDPVVDLRGVWVESPTRAYAVGTPAGAFPPTAAVGHVFEWDGSTWKLMTPNLSRWLYAVTGSGSDVYAVGAAWCGVSFCGTVHRLAGDTWESIGGPPESAYSVAVFGSDVIVGTAEEGCTPTFPEPICWVSGGVYVWDGATSFTPVSVGGSAYGLWADTTKVFGVGHYVSDGGFAHVMVGNDWYTQETASPELRAVWASDCNVFAVGEYGTILRRH